MSPGASVPVSSPIFMRAAPRPLGWCGYLLVPRSVEFWRHRDSRLHDRVRYALETDGSWRIERLAP